MKEPIYLGPGAEAYQDYLPQVALILLGAFILGYWLRALLNGKYKQEIKDLEDENAILRSKSVPAPVDTTSFENKIKQQRDEIARVNTKLNECYAAKIKAENSLVAARNESAMKASAPVAIPVAKPKPLTPPKPVAKPKPKPAVAKATAPKPAKRTSNKKDDLKKIEGVGPKIESLLNAAGIKSYEDVIATKPAEIKKILTAAGSNYAVHDPTTWGKQSKLANDGQWDKLKKLQDKLKGGRKA